MADNLHCCHPGCKSVMEFGGASRSMQSHPSEREMLETMAELFGWSRTFGDGWLCRDHTPMRAQTIYLRGPRQREWAKQQIDNAPDGWVVRIAAETRRDAQNRKLWPMLADIQRQVPGMEAYSTEDIKARFLNALGTEMRFLPELEGQGMFPTGLKSSTLTVQQFAALIELIYAYGAKHGVRWSEPIADQRNAA
jgi:hypothetical protein